jgi:hypothetical protein
MKMIHEVRSYTDLSCFIRSGDETFEDDVRFTIIHQFIKITFLHLNIWDLLLDMLFSRMLQKSNRLMPSISLT